MKIDYHHVKRDKTLAQRGLDFKDARAVFAGRHLTVEDDRKDYGEPRFITVGILASRLVILVWTPREGAHRIVNMRKANDREQKIYAPLLA